MVGFQEYWYPVTWSRKVRDGHALAITVCGTRILLARQEGRFRATVNPRPTTTDSPRFEANGTDGSSPRDYPVAERIGLVWVFIGEGDAPPLSDDMPSELLADHAVVVGRLTIRPGNWRFGAENGFNEGHAKFLHRDSLWTLRRQMPTWPHPHRWRSKGRGTATVSIRLPCFLRVAYDYWQHYEWWVPIDAEHHIYLQLVSKRANRLERIRFWFYYRSWIRWVFDGMFNDEDALMVDVMDASPERLYRPDIAITEWRNWCETQARGEPRALDRRLASSMGNGSTPVSPEGVRSVGLPITHRLRALVRR